MSVKKVSDLGLPPDLSPVSDFSLRQAGRFIIASYRASAYQKEHFLKRMGARLRVHDDTIGQRMERDLEALLPLSATAYDAWRQEEQPGQFHVSGPVPDQ